MDREIEADIARTHSDMSAQLARLQAMDDPVESIHAALTFEDALRQVILDLAEVCRTKLDDIASWAQGPATPRRPAMTVVEGGEQAVAAVRPVRRAAARKRPASRTTKASRPTKARGRAKKAAKRGRG